MNTVRAKQTETHDDPLLSWQSIESSLSVYLLLRYLWHPAEEESAPEACPGQEDCWDEPESDLTRALQASLDANSTDTTLPPSIQRVQAATLRRRAE